MAATVNLNALRVFAAAARHGNFQRAAKAIGLSPGAVSQRIAQLETTLGTQLFEREARGVRLTPAGSAYQGEVEAALAQIDRASAEVARAGDLVTLHLGPSFAARWLMPRMDALSTRFPRLRIGTEVHEDPPRRRLRGNELALWPGRAPDRRPGDHLRRLCPIRLVAVGGPNLPRPNGPSSVETLLALPLLQDAHRRWDRLVAETGLPARHGILNFDRSALALQAAAEGHGVAIAPTFLVDADLAEGRLVQLWEDPHPAEEDLLLSWPEPPRGAQALRQVVDWILTEFGQPAVYALRQSPNPNP